MDMVNLKYFKYAAETLNFTKAAKMCYISQTAISLAIAKMEKQLGFQLFNRTSRSVQLTAAGAAFYEWTCQTLKSYDEVVSLGADMAAGSAGRIVIGFSSSFEAIWFLPRLREFYDEFNNIHLEQRIMGSRELVEELKRGKIDALVQPPFAIRDQEVKNIVLGEVPLIVAMSAHNPLAQYDEVPVQKINRMRCYVKTFEGIAENEENFLSIIHRGGLYPAEIKEVHNVEEILLAVSSSNGVAILPSFESDYVSVYNAVRRPIADFHETLPFSFVRLRQNRNPVVIALEHWLEEHVVAPQVVKGGGEEDALPSKEEVPEDEGEGVE